MKLKRDWKGRVPTRSPDLAKPSVSGKQTSPRPSQGSKASKMTFKMPHSRHSNRKQPPSSHQAYQKVSTAYRKKNGQPGLADE